MALLKILEYPDPRLRIKAKPVPAVTDEIRQLAADMLETMYAAPGIGLAATQVDRHIRLVVLDVSEERNAPHVLINPVIVAREGSEIGDEGCLSVPGVTEGVTRAAQVRVKALDASGQPAEFEAEGLLGVCIQHELDHLDGKLFVDYLSEMKRQRLKKRAMKALRRDGKSSDDRPEVVPAGKSVVRDRAPVI
ncbi:MAG: peptide deformylase [Gammaproteobacteria bacterium PRO9]|nr:peptide deformylase [Gammaproteobacteria bacterium PRO9]